VEWFSTRSDHYRFELDPEDAWLVPTNEWGIIDQQSRQIRTALAATQVIERPKGEESDWM
jgi:hypothetical protein